MDLDFFPKGDGESQKALERRRQNKKDREEGRARGSGGKAGKKE